MCHVGAASTRLSVLIVWVFCAEHGTAGAGATRPPSKLFQSSVRARQRGASPILNALKILA